MALIHVGFFSQTLGMCVSCDVILPQHAVNLHAAPEENTRKYPVLWLLHGKGDNQSIWQRRTSIERYVEGMDLAVVMPNGDLSKYADMAHGGHYFSYITEELPRAMRSFFPLSDQREENFVAGLSMGGYGSLKIGMACPEKYSVIGCLSAGVDNHMNEKDVSAQRAARINMIYGDRDLSGTEEDIEGNIQRILAEGKPVPRVYHACGSGDFLLESAHKTKALFESIAGNPFDYTFEEAPGAHNWEFWDGQIQHFLRYLRLKTAQA